MKRKSNRLNYSNWLGLTEGAILATELREASADAVVAGAVAAAVVDADLAVALLAQDGADGEPVVAVVEDADEPLARRQKLEASIHLVQHRIGLYSLHTIVYTIRTAVIKTSHKA